MRKLGTTLNMLARLGFPRDFLNLVGWSKDCLVPGWALETLEKGNYAHVIYAATYRGKNGRNKTPVDIYLQKSDFECFKDDESFFKRANELYSKGVSWIGAFHAKA